MNDSPANNSPCPKETTNNSEVQLWFAFTEQDRFLLILCEHHENGEDNKSPRC